MTAALTPWESILLRVSLVLALASVSGFGVLTLRQTRQIRGTGVDVKLSAAPYVPSAGAAPAFKARAWSAPAAQSRGREWVYDTFTPPEIYYNARSKHFTVRPPLNADEAPEEPFGLELVSVHPEPFRLQLIGYVGGEGDCRGVFEKSGSGEIFVAVAGRHLADLDLTIMRVEARSASVALPQSMTTEQRVATALIHDERDGREVTLTHRERRFTAGLSALVAAPGESALHQVRQGEALKLGAASYRVEKIQLAPPAVEITKESPRLLQPERRSLTPRDADEPSTTSAAVRG